jgi:hypothetical protein
MHPRAAFRISLAAGLLVLAVTLLSATQEPVRPCGNLPQNYAPIIAFELARSADDLAAIFGDAEPCRSTVVERMDAVAALMCAAAFFSTVAAIAAPARFGAIVGLGVGLSWLAYLVTASGAAFRPVANAAELPRPG